MGEGDRFSGGRGNFIWSLECEAMEKAKIERINELAHLAKERALTDEELSERDALRKEYIEEFRRNTISVLENTYIVTPDGKKHPLPRKKQ